MKKKKNQNWQFIAVQTVLALIGTYAMIVCIAVMFT
jgi:hypothetical protein